MLLQDNMFSVRCRYFVIGVMVLSAGCIRLQAKQTFPVEPIRSIRPGMTTKQDILTWFGPPANMVRKGAGIFIPTANDDGEQRYVIFKDILDYFPARHEEENLVIYFYHYWRLAVPYLYVGYAPFAKTQKTVCMLWVLLDEDRNIVIDAAERTQESGGI